MRKHDYKRVFFLIFRSSLKSEKIWENNFKMFSIMVLHNVLHNFQFGKKVVNFKNLENLKKNIKI